MKLKLDRPIVFFDIEATGLSIATDRIVEISIVKVNPDGEETSITRRVNPEMHIPEEVSAIHGIHDDDVKDKPTFKELAPVIVELIGDSDIAGYNSSKFDVPMLAEELYRAGVDFDLHNRRFIDVQTIYYKKEPRTLSAAYKYYCNADLEGAHSANADTMATYEVLKRQLDIYPDLKNDIDFLSDYSNFTKNIDFAGLMVLNEQGEPVFNFGKNKGQKVKEVLKREPGYYGWVMGSKGFTQDTKNKLTEIKKSL